MQYDVEYFFNKFEAIPERLWLVDDFCEALGDRKCALGWCGAGYDQDADSEYETEESRALATLFWRDLGLAVASVNDGHRGMTELGDTPRERILNALILISALDETMKDALNGEE
jgi:hypothetical protein